MVCPDRYQGGAIRGVLTRPPDKTEDTLDLAENIDGAPVFSG